MDVMDLPLWQTIRSTSLSDQESLDRAYNNNQNFNYDGNGKYI